MPKLVILHLSDMHFVENESYTQENIRNIVNALHNSILNIPNLLIIVSGDLAHSGKKAQYSEFGSFLDDICNSIRQRYPQVTHIEFVAVPGNHDMDYDLGSYNKDNLEDIEKNDKYEELLANEFIKQAEYLSFAKKRGIIEEEESLINTKCIEFDGFLIQINLINTAVYSIKCKGDEGYHYISQKAIDSLEAIDKVDYIFSVMHHPHYWFNWNCKHQLSQVLIEKSDIVFLGHEHFSGTKSIEQDGQSTKLQEGGILSNRGNWNNSSFYIGVIELDTRNYQLSRYYWDNNGRIYLSEPCDERVLSKNRWNKFGFSLNTQFVEYLTKDKRFLVGQDIREYYVFPSLEEEKEGKHSIQQPFTSMPQFLSSLTDKNRILIKGGKESGKTILARQIFLSLYDDYNMPVLLDSISFSKINAKNPRLSSIENVFQDSLEDEYFFDKIALERYLQAEAKEKSVIIDDFDLICPEIQEAIINYINERYGIVILMFQRDIEFNILERARIDQLLSGFHTYTICPFFYTKRKELVERVVNAYGIDINAKNLAIDSVNSLLSNTQQLYRWDPSFIIQLAIYAYDHLQSAGTKDGDLFGYVFESNLNQLIIPFITPLKMEIGYALVILDSIAYSAHIKRLYPIPYDLIISAIEEYNKKYKYNCSPIEFISCMQKAGILKTIETNYVFCQSSYYAYFVAREIKRRWQDDNDCSQFINALECAYLPINANIVLFVTYIMDSKVLIRHIKDMAKRSIMDWKEFNIINPEQKYFSELCLPKPIHLDMDAGILEKARDYNEKNADIQMQKMWKTPYEHSSELSSEDIMARSLSLMILSSQLLPNLGYIIEGPDKAEFVELVYQMPLKIFNAWASEIDHEKAWIIRDIQHLYTLEYHDKQSTDLSSEEAALNYLRKESYSLLLELMNISMSNASRMSTFPLLDDFNHSISIGYELEWLMTYDKRPNINEFIIEAERIYKLCKNEMQKHMVRKIVYHYMTIKKGLSGSNIQRLNTSILGDRIPQRVLLTDLKIRDEQS